MPCFDFNPIPRLLESTAHFLGPKVPRTPPLRSKTRTILRKAGHKPYLGTLGIMDEGKPGMIQSVNVKTSVPTLSALQLVKGVKKDEETFVAHHLLNKPPLLGR